MSQHKSTLPLLTLLLAASFSAQAQEKTYAHNYKSFLAKQDQEAPEQDDAQGRIQWMRERMGGELDASFMRNLISEAAKERQKYPAQFPGGPVMPITSPAAGNSWRPIGPTSSLFTQNFYTLTKVDSGRPKTILPHPTDPNTVYLLNAGGGLWKTTDFLSDTPTWHPKTDYVGTNTGGSAAFGGVPTTLYVGMGDAFDLGVGGVMLASTNGGDTWTTAFLGTAADNITKVYDVKVDTTGADIILVGTNSGLYRSTNGGASYTSVASASGEAFFGKRVWGLVRTSIGWLASAEDAGNAGSLYYSTDQGATWTAITNAGGVYAGAGRTTLGLGAPGDAVVYAFAATAGDGAQLDLFKSIDGGQTWVSLGLSGKTPSNPNSDQTTMDVMHTQAFYNHMILVDPTDASRSTVYLGGNLSSVKTTDGGSSWTVLSNWLAQFGMQYIHADFHASAMSTTGGTSRIYFGTDGGLFTSTDGGATWDDTKNKGLATHLIYALASNPQSPDSAIIGLQDNGTRLRVGNTDVWNQVKGGDGFGVAWSQANNNIVLQSYVYSAIRRSTVNPPIDQSNFTTATTGITQAGSSTYCYFVTPMTTPAPTADLTGNVFFTNTKIGVYRTTNGASSWSAIGKGTLLSGSNMAASTIARAVSHGVGVSPVDINHVAVAGASGLLWITADAGATAWAGRDLDSANAGMLGAAAWPGFNANVAYADNSLMYVCSEAPTIVVGQARVAKSTDGGATWALAATGLPDVPVTKLAVDPGDATGATVYAATWLGVYKTTDGGTSWALFGNGLPQVRVTDIYVAPDSSYVRVATWGRGVWDLQTAPAPFAAITTPNPVQQGEIAVATVPAQPGASYLWNVSGGTILSGLNETAATFKAGTGSSMTLGVTVTAGDLTTASASQVVTIVAAPAPNATITSVSSAPQGTTGLTASVPSQAFSTYAWTMGGSGTITSATDGNSITYSVGAGATATLGVTVTNGGAVSANSNKVVTITAAPAPDATITAPGTLTQAASGFVASVPVQPFSTYAWSTTGGTINGAADGSSITYTAGTGTSMDISVTVTNAGSVSASSTLTKSISAAPAPVASITAASPVLHGSTGNIASVVAQPGATYSWSITGGTITSAANLDSITYTAAAGATLTLNVTVTSGSGATASDSKIVTVTQTGEYMVNPGYELGTVAWGGTTSEIGPYATAHSGSNLCYLDGYGTAHNEYIYQNVTLPTGVFTANLSFWLWISSSDAGAVANDTFSLDVYDSTGTTVLQHLDSLSNLNRSGGYVQHTYAIDPALMGQTVRIQARGIENASTQTGYIMDDWSLIVVAPTATTTTLSSGTNPSAYGQSVTFTATVTAGAAGTVTFKDGSTTLGTGALSSGVATFTTSALAGGTHSITAVYEGSPAYGTSTSSPLSQVVSKTASSVSLGSNLNPSNYGQSVTFTATASAGATGTVTFKDGSSTLGTGTLSSNVATFTTSTLIGGTHAIKAIYGGDGSYAGSSSSNLAQVVNLVLSPSSLANGEKYLPYRQTFTAAGATPTTTYALVTGSLPPGLTLSTAGVLSGTPTTPGSYSFSVRGTDSRGAKGTLACSVFVSAPQYNLSFLDDTGRMRVCLNSVTKAWQATVLTGPYAGTYTGVGLDDKLTTVPRLSGIFDTTNKRATYKLWVSATAYVSLLDTNTTGQAGGCNI